MELFKSDHLDDAYVAHVLAHKLALFELADGEMERDPPRESGALREESKIMGALDVPKSDDLNSAAS